MPRRRPGSVRASPPRRRLTRSTTPGVNGLSRHTLSEIARLERTRNYLEPGAVTAALRLWKDYVRTSERQLWDDYEWGNVHWYCCGNPIEARVLLAAATQALSSRSARELRAVITRLDSAWSPTSTPFAEDGS